MATNQATKLAIIRAGRELLAKGSGPGISVRDVMTRAGVNHGLFHYYFKTKERFFEEMVQNLFNEFYVAAEGAPQGSQDPLEKLRSLLIASAFFVRDGWPLLWPVLKDPTINKVARKRFYGKVGPHLKLLNAALQECRRKGRLAPDPDSRAMMDLLNSTMAPILMHQLMMEATPELVSEGYIPSKKNSVDKEEIHKSVDLALRRIMKRTKPSFR